MRLIQLVVIPALSVAAAAAATDRITGPLDTHQTVPIHGSIHRLAQARYDRGPVEPAFPMNHLLVFVRPSATQQAELDQLLSDQQNPSSPQFHKWLTPEEFGNRFGLTAGDHSKMVAWLHGAGFTVEESGRARNWIMFSGTAAQVEQAFHTSIHCFQVNGERHFANTTDLAIPAALTDLVGGFEGLHDFHPRPLPHQTVPDYNTGGSHYLVPGDYNTIYDINPLAQQGINGTGVNVGIVGESALLLSDIQMFRSTYGLPAADPKQILAGTSPGVIASILEESDLDIEWAGAVAPGATIYYYYSTSLTTAITAAVNANVVHILSISYGGAEMDNSTLAMQPVFQQANAQGITVFAGSGDYGAADAPDSPTFAHFGPAVSWPASYPEVTAVGGTQFDDTTGGPYWSSSNNPDSSSALGYIPEIAWAGGGGGPSQIFSKPAWQAGAGVPQDGARDLPDVSMAASPYDGFVIVYAGFPLTGIGGTSASTPCMAGITALLIHSLSGGVPAQGLGNINPQLYRLAQSSSGAFHDIISGSNAVTCLQGTPGCSAGTYGYPAGPGYDMATGIGSLDVNRFVQQWATATNGVTVTLSASPAKVTLNDTLQVAVSVAAANGGGTPSGTVDFGTGATPLASVTLNGGSAMLSLPGYRFGGTGTFILTAQYRGDAAFSSGGVTAKIQITAPTGVSSIVPVFPVSVNATSDPTGLFWEFSMSLQERGGVAAVITGVNVDGQDQPVSQYFPSPSIAANSALASGYITYRNLTYPVTRNYIFSGVDATGQTWSRQASITFLGPRTSVQAVILSAAPLVMSQDPSAPANCQWSQQLTLTETSGYSQTVSALLMGNIPVTDRIPAIFGTSLLAPYGSISGTLCWPAGTPGATDTVSVAFAAGWTQDIAVSFAGPQVNPAPISVSPSALNLSATGSAAPATASLSISVPDGQPWSIGISPQNLLSGWLSLSQTSGSGSAQIGIQASGAGLEYGAYHADLVIQGPNLQPAVTTVPVVFVLGDSSTISITGFSNAASGQSGAAPGMLAVLTGTGLSTSSFAYTSGYYGVGPLGGVLVTVNGVPAPVHSVAPTRIAFQVPYETGTGDAVVGVSHNNAAIGYPIQVTPSAPGIFADSSGNASPVATVQAGKNIAITMTGDGLTSPVLPDGYYPSPAGNLVFKPALPFTLTVGGSPAFLNSYGIAAGAQGVTTLNVAIPPSTPAGAQPVVVTVGGVASPPVNINVTPPAGQ